MMIVLVNLFARSKDLAGTSQAQLEVPAGATVADVRRALAKKYPALANLLEHSALAVADEFADDHAVIGPGTELALLPPVSGG